MKFKVILLAGDESLLSGPLPDQAELKDLPERSRGLNPTQVLGTYRYLVLMIAFGVGVWLSARKKLALRVISGILIAGSALQLAGSAFPMTHLDLNDTMHNIISGLLPPLSFLVTTGFGIAALGKRFLLFSILTLIVLVLVVVFIGLQTAQIAAGGTPNFFGISERVLTWLWFLWVMVLSIALLRIQTDR